MSFTFTVPSGSWEGVADPGQMIGITNFEGFVLGMGFLMVSSLNGDPCNWLGTADDIAIGPTVDDLVAGLTSSTEYETSDPTDVTLGGYSGKQVVVTMPTLGGSGDNYGSDCDEQAFRIWNAEGFTIYSQGPEQLWRLYILDVEGTRVVVMDEDFQTSRTDRRSSGRSLTRSSTRSRSPHPSSLAIAQGGS